ncbi:MAG: flagellar basal-body rod protein FlgF [Deltaproteobacteria bacterium]|nr:flagellar basal-body rod protein FlgF [Deltaproteobacteria bacterium]
MDAAMYKSLSGAIAQMRKLEVASQDLANVNTSGYKGQRLTFNEVLAARTPTGNRSGGFVAVGDQRTNFMQGDLQTTGNPFHLAIDGDGYFVVETARGERFTRSGGFTLSADGTVITPQGETLLGEGGPIQVSGGKMEVALDGTVRSENGEVGKLRIVRFLETRQVAKEGANLLRTDAANVEDVATPRVAQGSLEQSNVSPIDSMVSMITIQRQFEAYERAMKLMDGATQKMIADAGR